MDVEQYVPGPGVQFGPQVGGDVEFGPGGLPALRAGHVERQIGARVGRLDRLGDPVLDGGGQVGSGHGGPVAHRRDQTPGEQRRTRVTGAGRRREVTDSGQPELDVPAVLPDPDDGTGAGRRGVTGAGRGTVRSAHEPVALRGAVDRGHGGGDPVRDITGPGRHAVAAGRGPECPARPPAQ